MGFQKRWDLPDIYSQVRAMSTEINSHYNDGFTAFYTKQELYQIKWFIDDTLKNCVSFSNEAEWLKEENKKRIVKILKDEM